MPRAMWTGSISFGLVNIPVKLIPATKDVGVHFHQIHEKTKCRIRQKLVCGGDNQEISRNEIVKGYEIAPDQYVIVSDKELESVVPEAKRTIDIAEFVDLTSIDPIYYEKPYYLLPEEHAAKAYQLLVQAMKNSRKVAIARFVMRQKEYLATLRPLENVLCLETMRFAEEVIAVNDLDGVPKETPVGDKELKMAQQLIDSLEEKFQPDKYSDDYRDRIKGLIEKKIQGQEIITETPATKAEGRVISLMAALEQSLANAGQKKKGGQPSRKKSAQSG
jgi:DNA end-binding protein Ku